MLVFLDANVLFSSSLGGSSFDLLWELARAGRIRLCSGTYCVLEAERNLERKRPDELVKLHQRLARVERVSDPADPPVELASLLPAKDLPVLVAALEAGADVLVTGDLRHFGPLMERDDLPLRVRTVRRFLLDGPW